MPGRFPVARAAALCLAIATPVAAETAATGADAKALLAAAVGEAEAAVASRWAFTMTIEDRSSEQAKTYIVRFDPRRPEGERWTPLSPAADVMTKEERAAFKRISGDDAADSRLVYDGLAQSIGGLSLREDAGADAVFAGPIADPDMPKAVREALVMTVRYDRAAGHVAEIAVASTKPFKPAPPAKIERMTQVQRYQRLQPDWPPLLVASSSDTAGEAMFKSFESRVETTYADFERAD